MELRSSEQTSVAKKQSLTSLKDISVRYHNIFDYKLTKDEATKWQYKKQKTVVSGIKNKSRLKREKYSEKKLEIAKRAAKLISKVPTVLFVGITGSLAMMNASKNSDIDLIVITKSNFLWTTRFLVYFLVLVSGFGLRKPEQKNEKDKLCLNMWLDQTSLVWEKKDRNIYTAHEIAQIVPLVNKESTYEWFLQSNSWILNYWPNAVQIKKIEYDSQSMAYKTNTFERIMFFIQYQYMKHKITTEIVSSNKAIFHKNDWGKVVISKLNS